MGLGAYSGFITDIYSDLHLPNHEAWLIQTLNQNAGFIEATNLSVSNKKSVIHVLHVDDDPSLQEITKLMLLDLDSRFEIDHACCVDEALKKLSTGQYDVVVSDFEMPQKNGLQFLTQLREQKNEIPFILFTGKGREEVAIKALNLGADGYHNKQGSPETTYGELAYGIRSVVSRRKAEESLKASEESYYDLINAMNDTAWVIDFDAKFIDVNNAAVKVLGYSREEFLSMGPSDIDNSLSKEQIKNLVTRMQADQVQVFETTHTTKNGKVIPVEISSSLVSYHGKQAVLSIARNITERKKTERMLVENEERLRLKLNSVLSPDANIDEQELTNVLDLPKLQAMMDDLYAVTKMTFALIDLKGNVLIKAGWQDICTKFHRANPQTLKNCIESDLELTTGLKNGEIRLYKCKNNMWDVVTPLIINGKHVGNIFSGQFFFEDEPADRSAFIAQSEKYSFNKEEYLSAFERAPRWSREKIKALMLFNANLSEMISKLSYSNLKLAKALSDQKAIEQEFRETDERFRQLSDNAEEWIWEIDSNGLYTYSSSVAEKLLGYKPEEIVGKKHFYELFPVDEREELKKAAFQVFASKNVFSGFLNQNVHKNGSAVWLSTSGVPILNEKGDLLGYRGLDTDITERKKAEEKFKHAAKDFQVLNEKLRVVGSLTRHDVGNKLMAIKSYLYLLKKQLDDKPELAKHFDGIESALASSDKLFEFSRFYERIGIEEVSKIDVTECFNLAAALFQELGTIRVINDCQGLEVWADSLLRQLFYNFIDNSLKHGKKVTQIHLHYDKVGDGLKLFYEDNGVGIPDANKPKLFTEGFSTEKSTGRGLFLIKKMVEVYGWTITETGEPDKGAKFTIRIPEIDRNSKMKTD